MTSQARTSRLVAVANAAIRRGASLHDLRIERQIDAGVFPRLTGGQLLGQHERYLRKKYEPLLQRIVERIAAEMAALLAVPNSR